MSPTHNNLSKTVILLLFICAFAACRSYYKSATARSSSTTQTLASIDSLKLQNRTFILMNGGTAYYIKDYTLSADQKTLECILDTLPPEHQLFNKKSVRGKGHYRKDVIQIQVLNEVHLYIPQDITASVGNYTLAVDKIQKIEVVQKDRGRTTRSYIGGTIIIVGGALVLAAIIVLATKSSCPFVSGYTGNEFKLQGEIYGGAIYPQLARHDYLPLMLSPVDSNKLQLKISNELKERQFTDMADLWVINHRKGTRVIADDEGNLYSLADLQQPITAALANGKDVTAALLKANDNLLLYMDDTTSSIAANEVMIRFPKSEGRKHAKLMLTMKNSYFLDYLYGELAKGFGSYYATYMKQQKAKPALELIKWVKDQQMPLEVSVKTKAGWKKIKDITTIGPVATREIIVPLDLDTSQNSFTEIKLSSGFMFWEIDAASIDYSPDESFSVEKLKPVMAVDETGKGVMHELANADSVFLEQPEIGNTVTVTYRMENSLDVNQSRSYILHTRGYYEHIRDFNGKPDLPFLNEFKKPNAFPLYGMKKYKELKKSNMAFLK